MDRFTQLIIYEDETLIGFNKPAGLLSIPDGYDPALPHVAGLLSPYFGKLYIVHRLDRDTSGVMILARSLEIHRHLNLQFERRAVKKVYHAIVFGTPEWDTLTVDAPLRVNGDRRHRTTVSPKTGKPASTEFQVIRRFRNCTLLEARPLTGYTHQIRAHLLYCGHPILADPIYFSQSTFPLFDEYGGQLIARLALHAKSISFMHPITGDTVIIQAPYPHDFESALKEVQ